MRKKVVLKILKRYGFARKDLTLRKLSQIKNHFWYWLTWRDFLMLMLFGEYLYGELPEEGIYIKELNLQLGGRVTVYI